MSKSGFFAKLLNRLWLLLAGAIIVLAVLVSLARASLSYVYLLQDDIESFLSQKLDTAVKFESIEANWEHYGPRLQMRNIRVGSGKHLETPLTIEHLIVGIDFWSSLINLRVSTTEFVLHNSRVELDLASSLFSHQSDNTFTNSEQTAYSTEDFIVDTLLGQYDVEVSNIQFIFHKQEKQYTELKLNHLTIDNYDRMHQISGEAIQASGDEQGKLSLIIELEGDPRLPNSNAQIYINSKKVNVAELPLMDKVLSGNFQQGYLNGELWAHWNYEGFQDAFFDTELQDVQFLVNERTFQYPLVQAKLTWNKPEENLNRIELEKLSATDENSNIIQLGGVDVTYRSSAPARIELRYQDVEPGQLNSIWALMMDEPELQRWFLNADPELKVESFQIAMDKLNDDWELTSGFMQLDEIKLQRTQNSPSLPPLSGRVVFDGEQVFYRFESLKGNIDYRPLFRQTIPVEQMVIAGELVNYSEGSQVRFNEFRLDTPSLHLFSQGNLFFRKNETPELSLQGELSKSHLKNKSLYLPADVMGEGLINYLDESVVDGNLTIATLNMQVRLVDNLLDQADATFDIFGRIEDFKYQYLPDFPMLDTLTADLYFNQDSMFIKASDAKFEQLVVKSATAEIPQFSSPNPFLYLDIKTETDHASARSLVEQSWLSEILGNLLDEIKPQGRFRAETRIKIPLENSEQTQVSGKVALGGNTVDFPGLNFSASKVIGDVAFDEHSISARSVTSELFGGNSTVSLTTDTLNESKVIRIVGNGNADSKQVIDWVLPNNTNESKGSLSYEANGWICLSDCGQRTVVLSIDGDLNDTTLALPKPLAKSAKSPGKATFSLEQGQVSRVLQFSILDDIVADLHFKYKNDGYAFSNGSVKLGQQQDAMEIVQNELAVIANVKDAELMSWLNVVTDVVQSIKTDNNETSEVPLIGSFAIERLWIAGFPIHTIKASLSQSATGDIVIDFESDEAKGKVTLTSGNQIQLTLDSLVLAQHWWDALPESSDEKNISSFKDFPTIIVDCQSCIFREFNLGKVIATISGTEQWLELVGKVEREGLLSAPIQIQWRLNDGNSQLQAQTNFSSRNIGGLLRDWGFKVGIKDSRAAGGFSIRWSGAPNDFDVNQLQGSGFIGLSSGHMEEVSDAKARIFSLLSLQSVLKRLTLDFKDIYKDGFFYDSMNGNFVIRNGVVSTHQFSIDGNAADVEVSGSVNLPQQTFDQIISVTPKVTSSLPLLAGWAVEPTTGIAVWLLSKIFEPAIDVITNIQYRITGPWDEPVVTELDKSVEEVELTDEQYEAIKQVQEKSDEGSSEDNDQPDDEGNDQGNNNNETGSLPNQQAM